MKKKVISVLMLTLMLTSMLGMVLIIKPSFAENVESTILGKDFMEKTNEITLPNKANKQTQLNDLNGWQKKFERKTDDKEDKNLESLGQTSRDGEDRWNFNDTSEWNKFAYIDGNKTRLIVGVNDERSESLLGLERIVAKYQAEIINDLSIEGCVKAVVVKLLLASVTAFVEEVRVEGLSSYIEPNMKVQAQLVPNDPDWSLQWGPQKIEADWAWNITVGDPSVLVAVVDTGIYYIHSDLATNYAPLGYDWVNNDNDPIDDHGHGTHCAGIIAAVLNNYIGIAGLAQVRVMAEKVLDSGGGGYLDWVANGIIHATDCGADIISMSLGGYGYSELLHAAVKYAYDSGVLVIAAAGNDNTNMKLYPAGYDEVVAVAATDQYDYKAGFSNWGDWIELAGPGVDIYSTVPWGYMSASGTSMACPHISGVAALIWSLYPNKTRDWVRLWLRHTVDDLGDPGFDVYYGYGRINARKAVEQTPPAHELIVYEWITPPYVEPGALGVINATILNFGENNETDVVVQLLVNDTITASTSIGFLATGNSATVGLVWNPTVEGLYNITLYVVPVIGEANLENNVIWKYIWVGFPVKAVVLHSAGNILGDIITNWQALNSEWYRFGDTMVYVDYATLNKEDITYEDIVATEANALIISCAYDPDAGWQFTDSEIEAIKRYVHEGHGLIATAGTLYNRVPNNNKLAPLFGLNKSTMWTGTWTDLLHLVDTAHPIFTNITNPLVFPQVGTALPYDGRWDSNELMGGTYLALGHYQESAIVTYKGLVYISPWLEIIPPYYRHHLQLLYNAITWSSYQKPQHELIVSLDAPRYLRPGESALLNATVSNMGLNNETNVELYLLIDGAIVNSTTISELKVGESYKINFLWASTIEGMYNITAYSPPLLGEEFTFNNVDSAIVYVRYGQFVLWDDTKDTDGDSLMDNYLYLYQLLTASGFIVDELTIGPITSTILANYDILVLMDPELDFSSSEIADIQSWVATGKVLICIPDGGYPPTMNTLMAPYGVQLTGNVGGYGTTTDIINHPITQNVGAIYVDWVREISVSSPSTCLAWVTESGQRYGFLSTTERGEVIVISDSNIMDNYGLGMDDNTQLMLNIFYWVGIKREHDLAVRLESPVFLEPDTSVLLNATVYNWGLSNETDVELQLLINDSVVNSVVIAELLTGANYTISYLWTPVSEGIYNVTAYAPPLLNEEYTRNNLASVNVWVRHVIARVAVLNSQEIPSYFAGGWSNDYQTLVDALNAQGFYAQAVTNEEIIGEILKSFDVFVIVDNVPNDAAVPWVVNFWSNGGGIVAFDSSICFLCYTGILPPESAGSNGYYFYWDYETSYQARISVEHPVTAGYEVGQIIYGTSGDAEYRVEALAGTSAYSYYVMLVEDITRPNRAYASAYEPPSAGKVVHIWDQYHWGNKDLQLMILNAMKWATVPRYEHDLAVSLVVPSSLEFGSTTLLNATVRNRGLNNETDVELYLLINGTMVSSAIIPELLVDESYTLNYLWTPTRTGNYNITAYAPPVREEEYTVNNIVTKRTYVFFYTRFYLPHEWVGGGDPMGWHADDASWQYTLPFDFPFYGINYRTMYISSNGLMTFIGPDDSLGNSIPELARRLAIAPAWDDWMTNQRPGDDIYIWQPDPDHIVIRWQVVAYYDRGIEANFEAILGSDGVIQLNYAYNNGPVSATIGISNGAGHILAEDVTSLNYINTIVFTPFLLEHELTVSLDAPLLLELGSAAMLSATVRNHGLSNETNVELQLLINGTVVSSATIPELVAGQSYTIYYLWTPAVIGTYNVTAYTPPVLGEEQTANNMATGMVIVFSYTDIAVTDVAVSSNMVYQGWIVDVNVIVANLGGTAEAFTVTLYYDSNVIATENVLNLEPNVTLTLSFAWNTTNVPHNRDYVIKSMASILPWETNTTNNEFVDGSVRVKILGDVNGDGYVNIKDATLVGFAFGSKPSDPNWNPQADLNQDGYINIKDIVLLGKNFGAKPQGCIVKVEAPSEVPPNTTFIVSIIAENIPNQHDGMAGWELVLTWTPGVINCIEETLNLNYWPHNSGPLVSKPINNIAGRYHQALTLRFPSTPVIGTYWLVNLTFQSTNTVVPLETNLIIQPGAGLTYCLVDRFAEEIPHVFLHGHVRITSSLSFVNLNCSEISGTYFCNLNTWKRRNLLQKVLMLLYRRRSN